MKFMFVIACIMTTPLKSEPHSQLISVLRFQCVHLVIWKLPDSLTLPMHSFIRVLQGCIGNHEGFRHPRGIINPMNVRLYDSGDQFT